MDLYYQLNYRQKICIKLFEKKQKSHINIDAALCFIISFYSSSFGG